MGEKPVDAADDEESTAAASFNSAVSLEAGAVPVVGVASEAGTSGIDTSASALELFTAAVVYPTR
jgi:hypothetical protein